MTEVGHAPTETRLDRAGDSYVRRSIRLADRAHRKQHQHLDAYIGVTSATALHDELRSRGALITKPLEAQPWSCIDFYVEDPDGYILCFSEPTDA